MNVKDTHSRLTRAAAFLAANAPPKILKYFNPDCCIAASKVAFSFMQRLGFSAMPQVTRFVVYTENLWKRVDADQWDGQFRDYEWSVAIGYGTDKPRPDGFNGHLIVLASEGNETFLIDLSLGQASRPKKGIVIPHGLALQMTHGWPASLRINSCVLQYKEAKNPNFLVAPDWTKPERTEPLVEELLAEYLLT